MLAKKMMLYDAIENFRRIVNTEQWVKKSSVPCRIWLKTKMNLATKKDVAKDSQSRAASRTSVFTYLRSVPATKKKVVKSRLKI